MSQRHVSSQQWLDGRSPLRRRLDTIRSTGLYDHERELDERRRSFEPLSLGSCGLADDETLLRNGPWYADDREMALRERDGEVYDFEPAIAARRALADNDFTGSATGRSGADRPRPIEPPTTAGPVRHTNEVKVQPAKSRGAVEVGARLVIVKVSGSPWVSVRSPRQMVLLHPSEFGSRK